MDSGIDGVRDDGMSPTYGVPGHVAKPISAFRRRAISLRRLALAALLGVGLLGPGARPALAAHPIRLLALGDSLTAGYGLKLNQGFVPRLQAALRAAGRHVVVLNGGVSGDTTADGLARLDWALGEHPEAAIVELGANDALRGLPPATIQANLTAILDRLAARHIPVLLAGMYAPPNMGAAYAASFHAVFQHLSTRPGIIYDPFFLEGAALHPLMMQPDEEHPTAAGVERIVARLLPLVEHLLDKVPPT